MSKKLVEQDVIKIEESSIYVADLSRYPDALAFARAVAEEVKADPEWYISLKPEAIAERVTTSYMQYSFEDDEYPKGAYYLQDRATPEEQVEDRLLGREVFHHGRFDIKIWYVDLEKISG